MVKTIARMPRLIGITSLLISYHKTNDMELMNKARSFIINEWIISNGLLCNKSYSLNELSKFLKVEPTYIQSIIRDRIISSPIWVKEKNEEILNGLIGEQISWAFSDRMEIQQQLALLKNSQKGKYAPFISGEVNKALKLSIESSTSLQSLIRNFYGNSSITINQQQNIVHNESLTKEDALKLISENTKDHNDLQYLEGNYDLKSLPSVNANDQEGVDTSKEALNSTSSELSQITDDYNIHLDKTNRHSLRRMSEIGETL